jgi:NAD(P)-dependent dehydrogenase (short-subunit alcohol dehydrogenase family)
MSCSSRLLRITPATVQRVVDAAFTELGAVDVIVNNVGYGLFAGVEEASREQAERVLATNLTGSIDVIRAVVPHLRAQGHGRIVQVSSAGGQATYPGFAYYQAAKWGIEGFCEAIAPQLAHFGIGITIVESGATPTGFSAGVDRTRRQRLDSTAAIAERPGQELLIDTDGSGWEGSRRL